MNAWFRRSAAPDLAGLPAEVAAYAGGAADGADSRDTFDDVRFVVLDTECTGLDCDADRILSIGAVGVNNCRVCVDDSFEILLHHHDAPEGEEAIVIHEIMPADARQGVGEEEALIALLSYLRQAVFVGHHAGFDTAMLNRSLRRCFGIELHNPVVDTARLAFRLDNPMGPIDAVRGRDWALDPLCRRFNVPVADRHTAAGDAYTTALLLLKLLERAGSAGLHTIGDLTQR